MARFERPTYTTLKLEDKSARTLDLFTRELNRLADGGYRVVAVVENVLILEDQDKDHYETPAP